MRVGMLFFVTYNGSYSSYSSSYNSQKPCALACSSLSTLFGNLGREFDSSPLPPISAMLNTRAPARRRSKKTSLPIDAASFSTLHKWGKGAR